MSTADVARLLKLGLVQMSMAESADENQSRAERGIREAAGMGARLICLPELYRSRYFCQTEDTGHFGLAEEVPGRTTEALASLAAELDVTLVASLFERRAAGVFHNTAAVIDGDDGYVGKYRKMHIPDDPRYYEKFYFSPGDLGFKSFHTRAAELGVLICWDQWYPEAARLTALRGAELLVYPTAIGWHPSEKAEFGAAQLAAWQTIQRSHAIANGVFVVAVNRVGHEGPADGGLTFWGHSFVADPFGVVLAEAGEAEETLVVELDLSRQEWVRRNWPFFRDRRIDAYADITSRFIDR
jgi:N-carbamoylputrescine amidase